MMGKVTIEAARSDIGAFVDFLDDRAVGRRQPGSARPATAWAAGCRSPPRRTIPIGSSAAASFHGGYLVTDAPDSPHRGVESIAGRVYVAGPRRTTVRSPTSTPPTLEAALTDAGVDHTVEIYPALHGFAVTDNLTYDAAAAERHWSALEDALRREAHRLTDLVRPAVVHT